MEKGKIRVGVLFGGKSSEHEISLLSAKNVIEALDPEKYDVVLIAIDKQGQWHIKHAAHYLEYAEDPHLIQLHKTGEAVALIPKKNRKELVCYRETEPSIPLNLDVIFPILHGTYGEDGTIQGLLQLANIPFVGAGVLGSAIGMDKEVMKRLLRDAKIPIAPFLSFREHERDQIRFEEIVETLALPFFVKPANAGSSIGISKVGDLASFESALDMAFLYDRKIICEQAIVGREIECSVLGNEYPIASLPGEVVTSHEFYSYEAKYHAGGATLHIPADLPTETCLQIQNLAIETYQSLDCEGMARIDFFLTPEGKILVNEINTIPGFTQVSMYPKMWEVTGLSYRNLLDRLVSLAFERFEREKKRCTEKL